MDIGAYEFQMPQSTISYVWLKQYDLLTDGSADLADPYGDGHNNWQEWRAWTDPTNSASALRLFTPVVSTNNPLVRWQSVSGRTYRLERSSTLTQGSFEWIATNILGQSGGTTYLDTDTPPTQSFFYRVGVEE